MPHVLLPLHAACLADLLSCYLQSYSCFLCMPLAKSVNDARKVWATIQTYLQHSSRHRAARRAPTSEEGPADHKVKSDTRCQPQHHHYVCSATSFSQTVTMRGMWCGWTLYITCRSPRDRNCSCSEPGFCSNLSLSELPLASQSRASTKLQSRHAQAPKHFRVCN